MGIWGFSGENYALLSLVLPIQKTKTHHEFPHKTENPETIVDFPETKRKLGKLATLVLQ